MLCWGRCFCAAESALALPSSPCWLCSIEFAGGLANFLSGMRSVCCPGWSENRKKEYCDFLSIHYSTRDNGRRSTWNRDLDRKIESTRKIEKQFSFDIRLQCFVLWSIHHNSLSLDLLQAPMSPHFKQHESRWSPTRLLPLNISWKNFLPKRGSDHKKITASVFRSLWVPDDMIHLTESCCTPFGLRDSTQVGKSSRLFYLMVCFFSWWGLILLCNTTFPRFQAQR